MNVDTIQQFGIPGILLLLLLREIVPLLSKSVDRVRNGKNDRRYSSGCALSSVCEARHDVLRVQLETLTKSVEAQTVVLQEIARDVAVLKSLGRSQ